MPSEIVVKSAEFVKSCAKQAHWPPPGPPEIAFAGRSNVGKSSLINCLLRRRKLVRTSRTPGRTQLINYFNINGEFYFVDLPGYGYAKVPDAMRESWGPMVETYLRERRTLKAVIQIMDLRHPPTVDDLSLWHWLRQQPGHAIAVFTKADKIKRMQRKARVEENRAALSLAAGEPVVFSATTGEGRDELWGRLSAILYPPTPDAAADSEDAPPPA